MGNTSSFLSTYLESVTFVQRLHQLLLDTIKDEFARSKIFDINPVQALLLFNIGDNDVSAGELRSRGYYQGSNVSYNLKKLVEMGFIHHERSHTDRRSVRIKLTSKGKDINGIVAELFIRHAVGLEKQESLSLQGVSDMNFALTKLARHWTTEIHSTH